jgi:hypothetical protein
MENEMTGATVCVSLNGDPVLEVPFQSGDATRKALKGADERMEAEGLGWGEGVHLLVQMIEHAQGAISQGAAVAIGGLALWAMSRNPHDFPAAARVRGIIRDGGKIFARIETTADEIVLRTDIAVPRAAPAEA